jgi:hypothetical protein
MKQNSRWKSMKGTPMVTTSPPRLYNKIMNQEKKEPKHREEGMNIEMSLKTVKKTYFYCAHKDGRFIVERLSISPDIQRQLSCSVTR